jgi:hypothetical protein
MALTVPLVGTMIVLFSPASGVLVLLVSSRLLRGRLSFVFQ